MNAYIVRKESYDEKGYWIEDNLIITLDKVIARKECISSIRSIK